MKSKLANAQDNISAIKDIMICPICSMALNIDAAAVKCDNNHTFNISKKGLVNFASPLNDKIYNKELFTARKIVLNSGIYDQVYKELIKLIKDNSIILDAGAGEGTYLDVIVREFSNVKTIGLDLAKAGLEIASDYQTASYFLADLANIPLADNSLDYILNILSPANYAEFDRILKNDGCLIKVIVNDNYLKEIRNAINKTEERNDNVYNNLAEQMDIISESDITYEYPLDHDLATNLIKMTPMTNHIQEQIFIDKITIDLKIIVARKKV